ncbi:hypothetical protein P4534_23365 [Peribacillus butanolivorans]|uniref:hypothetical protein n=1 Tax=Peribacillus butanolivorans TaxID=421767 RepID=UPI002E20DAED|nr:hypothetical protein [Peribacillus butanolivorans]
MWASYNHSTGLKIYVDGNLVASNTTNLGPLPTVTNKIVLGSQRIRRRSLQWTAGRRSRI